VTTLASHQHWLPTRPHTHTAMRSYFARPQRAMVQHRQKGNICSKSSGKANKTNARIVLCGLHRQSDTKAAHLGRTDRAHLCARGFDTSYSRRGTPNGHTRSRVNGTYNYNYDKYDIVKLNTSSRIYSACP
jgi:hypothetical protein